MRLTLRTLLAYIDDTLDPARAREIGQKVAENPQAQELIDRIKRVTRRRGLATPPTGNEGSPSDPNTVAQYLSDTLAGDDVAPYEKTCLDSDVHLAEVAACHQILTLVLSEQIRVPPTARRRMYQLVKGRESIPDRKPGNTIPVGGVREDNAAPDLDDADAPYLLGLSAYSRAESGSQQAVRIGILALLLLLLGFGIWMAVPAADRTPPDDTGGYALVSVPSAKTEPTPPAKTGPSPMPKPDEKDTSPKPGKEPKKPDAMPAPPEATKDLVPTVPAPKADRIAVGKLDRGNAIVLRKPPGSETWERVPPDQPAVFGTDRLVALPGYKAPLRLDLDVTVELWGNLPELLPAPLFECSVTPAAPPEGFDADVTVHVGRVYLSTRRAGGAKARLRFGGEVWDVTLADAKTEVVLEVAHTLSPGALPEPPRVSAVLAVREGLASLRYRQQSPAKLTKGTEVFWDSKGGKTEVRPAPEGGAAQSGYWTKNPVSPNAQAAEAALTGLDLLSKAMADPKRVRATFEEALQLREDRPTTRAEAYAARVAVFGFGAIEDVPGLVYALTDPIRPLVRGTAVEAIRNALALDPKLADRLRQGLAERQKLTDDEAGFALHMLRGFTPAEASDPGTLDRLVATLSSPSICLRELAIGALAAFVDPQERGNEALFRYDAGAPPEVRDPVYRMWLRKLEDRKKPGPEQAPPPKAK